MGPQPGTGVNRDVNFLVPAVAIAALYAFLMLTFLDPGSTEVAQKTRHLETLEQSGPTPAMLAQLGQQERELKDQRNRAELLLADVRREARQVSGQNNDPVARLGLLSVINDVFVQQGLLITDDHSADSGQPRLAASLDEAAARLESLINKTGPSGQQNNIPPEMMEEIFGTPAGGSGRARRQLLLREMQVVGGYRDMIGALEALARDAGDSVVLGVGLERKGPADQRLLQWTVTLHVQPSPDKVVVQQDPVVSAPPVQRGNGPSAVAQPNGAGPDNVFAASRRQ